MQLTPLQLQIQERADKTLSFGCILKDKFREYYVGAEERVYDYCGDGEQFCYVSDLEIEVYTIIGHPMNRGRLCYLLSKLDTVEQGEKRFAGKKLLGEVERRLGNNQEYYQQTVLERPVELQELVLAFLNTLGPL